MSAHPVDVILERGPVRLPAALRPALIGLSALGLVALVLGLVVGHPEWSVVALLVATLVVIGVAQVGIVVSAIFQITNAKWGRSFRRVAELTLFAAPVGLAGLLVLVATGAWWAPFAHMEHLTGGKELWLSVPFWAVRNFVAVALLFALGGWFFYWSARPDLGAAKEADKAWPGRLTGMLTRGWKGTKVESELAQRRLHTLAPAVCIVYALVSSMVGFDLVMALDPDWYSTLFGAYHFIGNIYMGLAVIILLAAVLRPQIAPGAFLSGKHFGLLATLMFAFCLVNGDFFWSQFLVIWYGNLPEETSYVILRTMDPAFPWRYLAFTVLIGFFLIPFLALLLKAVKWYPVRVAPVAGVIVLAIIAERFLVSAPPLLGLQPGAGFGQMAVPLVLAVLASLGFIAAGGLIYGWAVGQVPLLPISDPRLLRSLEDTQEKP